MATRSAITMVQMAWLNVGACALVMVGFSTSLSAQLRFTQDFERLKPDSDGSPAMLPLSEGWRVEGGRYVQTAGAERYDLPALFPNYLRGRYVLRLKLAHQSAFFGGGVFFNLSSKERLEFGHMVRFDGAHELLYGSFYRGSFEPDGRLFVPVPIETDQWIELALEVDELNAQYTIRVQGEVVGKDLPLRYNSGYAGLQVSNGRVAFDDVYAEIQRDWDRTVRWPGQFALCEHGFAAVEPVNGRLIAFDTAADQDLEMRSLSTAGREITKLATRRGGGFVALEGGAARLRWFDAGGKEQSQSFVAGLATPTDLDVDAQDRVHLLAASGDVLVLNAAAEPIASGFLDPDQRQDGHFEVIAVRGDGRGLIFDVQAQRAIEMRIEDDHVVFGREHILPVDVRDAAFARAESADEALLYIACGDHVEARHFSDQTGLSAVIDTTPSNADRRWSLECIEVSAAGWIAVSDRAEQRFLRLPPELSAARVSWDFESDGRWHATWTTARADQVIDAELIWTAENGVKNKAKLRSTQEGRSARLEAEAIPRNRPVEFIARSGIADAVPSPRQPLTWRFRSAAEPGQHNFVRMRILALVYTDVRHVAPEHAVLSEPAPLSVEERTRIASELREAVAFYWLNSGFRLWLDLDLRFIDDSLQAGEIHANGEAEGEPLQRELEQRAHAFRLNLESFAGVAVISARRSLDVASGTWMLQGRGGGLTIGPEARGYALSWWSAPPFQGANHWLFIHEFHHQLDAMFTAVGHPEYWFNHFSPTIGTAARFGEHHDGNAYLLRAWPEWKWWALLERPALNNRQRALGEIDQCADRDDDGFPDEDLRLPLDERRFGSSPTAIDSDSDGLSDRDEARLQIKSGLGGAGWTQAVFAAAPNPLLRDADGDQISDAADPEPLYAVTTDIPQAQSTVDGAFAEEEATQLFRVSDPLFTLQVAASHNEGALHLILEIDRPAEIELLIDGRDDGWFVGRENYRLRFDANKLPTAVDCLVQDAATAGRWPFETDDLVPSARLHWKSSRTAEGAVLFELRLPSATATNFSVAPGQTFGLAVAVKTVASEAEGRGALSVFEPHRFVQFRLIP